MEDANRFDLSQAHMDAVDRHRRVIVNFDAISADGERFATKDVDELARWKLMFADETGSHIDSVWWSWGEGNQAPYPSKILSCTPGFKQWVEAGFDIVQSFLNACKKRGLETFISHRMNTGDSDRGTDARLPIKQAHADWVMRFFPRDHKLGDLDLVVWNYAVPEVRKYKLSVLREVAENYDFDGMELDFSRRPLCLPIGRQWVNRDHLTQFIRQVRSMLLEIERRRGRPFLLAARVGENLLGCHYDGMDVQAWAQQQLVDILTLGSRSFDVDITDFRRITAGRNIKLYPCLDDHHATDGYRWPPIEVLRGVFTNWWRQGADGMETFNWGHGTAEAAAAIGMYLERGWRVHRQAYHEMGDYRALKHKDKIFVLQRRGGGGWGGPDPDDWYMPRHWYLCTNMFAPLPANLDPLGKADALMTLFIGDDLAAQAGRINSVTLRLLLNDSAGIGYVPPGASNPSDPPAAGRIERGLLATDGATQRYNCPPVQGIECRIDVRINNALLETPVIEHGWLVFTDLNPRFFAVGDNLIGVVLTPPLSQGVESVSIEKLEVHVKYNS